tara:strand:+ start:8259 stop:8870 length:612 start_codon:yes stop_codon:yes gene_type:complete
MINNPLGFTKEINRELKVYENLLKKWQNKFNLVSNNSIADIWSRHILDSAQLFKLMPKENINQITYDIGTGAGFPGVVLAILGRTDMVLCDPNKKKCSFLQEVKNKLNLNMIIDNIRAEELPVKSANIVLARAVAPLEKLISLSWPLLKKNGIAIFPKGKNWKNELISAQKYFFMEYDLVKSITSEVSYIFVIKRIEKKIDKK